VGSPMPLPVSPHISWLDLGVIVAYLLAVLGVGVYQARKIRTSGDYYAGGRKFNKFYLMMHALGTASHADEPVSVVGAGFQKGVSGIWYTYLYLPLTPIFWLLAPYIRRTRFVTMADFFRARYGQSMAVLYSLIGVLKMSVSMGVVLKGTATIVHSMSGGSVPEAWAVYGMTAVFVTYGFAGGLRATVITETIQGPLIVLMSLLLVPFGLYAVGGFAGLHHALDAGRFSLTLPQDPSAPGEFTPAWIIAASLTALIGFVAQPGIIAAFASGKSELEGRVGYTYGTMIKRLCAIAWVFTGVIIAAMVVRGQVSAGDAAELKHREYAFGFAMQRLMPRGLLGLMVASILAAQMATLSAFMVNSSALASRNLYHGFIRPKASDQEILIVGRVLGLVLVAIGVYLAREAFKDVADALTMLLQFSSIMGVIVWAGVLWKRTNNAGAWAGVIVLFLTWATLGPIGELVRNSMHGEPNVETPTTLQVTAAASAQGESLPAWVGGYAGKQYIPQLMVRYLPAGVLALIVVSLLTPPPPSKQVDDFFMLLKTPVGQEQKLIDAGVPIIYAGSSSANALEKKYPKLVHWGGFSLAAIICVLIMGLLKLLAGIGS
jgi:Na+/proline symporter